MPHFATLTDILRLNGEEYGNYPITGYLKYGHNDRMPILTLSKMLF